MSAPSGSSVAASMEKQFADFEKEEQAEREKFFGDALVSGKFFVFSLVDFHFFCTHIFVLL
jgi:hypothetical protein